MFSGVALARPAREGEPRESARVARAASRSEPASLPPEEMGLVTPPEAQGVDAAGALGMLTALTASFVFVFARSRRAR